MKYCKIVLDKKGKKQVDFGKKWGDMPKSEANASFIQTGEGMYVIDIDFKKVKKAPTDIKAFVQALGMPTVETARGAHYYVKSDVTMTNHQNIFNNKEWGVDIRGAGGIVFNDYWGKEKGISYAKTGGVINDSKGTIFKLLPKEVREPKERGDGERGEVGLANEADVKRMLSKINAKDFRDRDAWLGLIASIYHGLGEAGEDLAREWSKTDKESYDEKSFNNIWQQCVRGAFGESYTVGSLKYHADEVMVEDEFEPVTEEQVKKAQKQTKKQKKAVEKSLKHPVFSDKRFDWMRSKLLNPLAIYKYLENSVWDVKGQRVIWLDPKGEDKQCLRNDIFRLFRTVKSTTLHQDEREKLEGEWEIDNDKEIKKYYAGVYDNMLTYLIEARQMKELRIEVDMHKTKPQLKFIGNKVEIVLNNPFARVKIKQPKFETAKYLKDFKEHFSHFDEFLELIVAARFASNRKKAYLHTKMVSDFGKSFLGGIFKELGLLVEVDMAELKKAVKGEPSGLNVDDFIFAWITQFDEIKFIPAELKKIYNEVNISAKGQQRTTVATYMKWLSSAEDVKGMKGVGADQQFANRISAWDMGEHTLDSRPLFAEDNAKYFIGLKWEIYKYLKKAIKHHVAIGKEESYKESQAFITAFHSKYGIEAGLESTMGEFHEVLLTHIKDVVNTPMGDFKGIDGLIYKTFFMHKTDGLKAKNVGSMSNIFNTIAKEHYGMDYKALEYKDGYLRDLFEEERTGKGSNRGYKLVNQEGTN